MCQRLDIRIYSQDTNCHPYSDIFLIDHAWTTKPETSKAQLLDNPQLVERLTSMMDIQVDEEVEEEEEEQATDGEVVSKNPDLEVDETMVQLVASQGNVSERRAKIALQNEGGDIIAALMSLTLHADHDAQGLKNLEGAIGGQVRRDKEAKAAERKKLDTIDKIMIEMWKFSQTYEYAVVDPSGQTKKESAWCKFVLLPRGLRLSGNFMRTSELTVILRTKSIRHHGRGRISHGTLRDPQLHLRSLHLRRPRHRLLQHHFPHPGYSQGWHDDSRLYPC